MEKMIVDKIEKLFTHKWLIVFLLIPYIKPATELTGSFDIIFDLLKVINTFFIIGSYIFYIRKPSKILITISLLQISFIIPTIINNGRIWWIFVQALSVISLCALVELTFKIDKKIAIESLTIALVAMAFATICSMFIYFPNGMYTVEFNHDVEGLWHIPEKSNYLWGFDNSSIFKFIVTIIVSILNSIINEKKFNKIIAFSITLLSTIAFIYVKSITAAVICIMFLIYLIFLNLYKKSISVLNFRNCFIIVLVIFLCLMLFNSNIEILQNIASKTDKVTSLNYRFIIWDNTINAVKENWLFGYGFQEALKTAHQIGIDHPHNIFLDIIYRGGIISTSIFIVLLMSIYKKMMKYKSLIIANVLTIGLFGFFCISQMDYYNEQYLLFILYMFAYHIDILKGGEKKNEYRENFINKCSCL